MCSYFQAPSYPQDPAMATAEFTDADVQAVVPIVIPTKVADPKLTAHEDTEVTVAHIPSNVPMPVESPTVVPAIVDPSSIIPIASSSSNSDSRGTAQIIEVTNASSEESVENFNSESESSSFESSFSNEESRKSPPPCLEEKWL